MQVFWQNKFAILHFLYNAMYISKLLFTEMCGFQRKIGYENSTICLPLGGCKKRSHLMACISIK